MTLSNAIARSPGRTILVSTKAEFADALKGAGAGDTILLKSGDYGSLTLVPGHGRTDFPGGVTIASADPGHPAKITGLSLLQVSNLSFDGILFDYTAKPGAPPYASPFALTRCDNISIRNSVFDGDVAKSVNDKVDGFATGIALSVGKSTNITIENNEVFNFNRGITAGGSDDVVIRGNDLHGLRMDGMNFVGVQGVVIEDNHIHDFKRSNAADHADMIQFWTNNATRPSTDITIRGNVLTNLDGGSTQSIFMRNDQVDQGLAGREMFYRNVLIEDNVIVNGQANGLVLGETDGLVIRNNTVLHGEGVRKDGVGDSAVPLIKVAGDSTHVVIESNVAAGVPKARAGWVVGNNVVAQDQDPSAPGFYGKLFVASTLEGGDGTFVALPGGAIHQMGAGAEATREGDMDGLSVQIQAQPVPGDDASVVFDAGLTKLDGAALPKGSTFEWSFGDGTTSRGVTVTHSFAGGGLFDVKLKVVTPGGAASEASFEMGLEGPDVVRLTKDKGFVAYENGQVIDLTDGAALTAKGLVVHGKDVAYRIKDGHIDDITGADDFQIKLTLDDVAKGGELLRMQGTLITSVDGKGEVLVRAFSEDGAITLKSSGAHLLDGKAHDITLAYADDRLELRVDGKAVSKAMDAPLKDAGDYGLSIGSKNNDGRFHALVTDFEVTAGAQDFHSTAKTAILQVEGDGGIRNAGILSNLADAGIVYATLDHLLPLA